jgi:hypothetical protein
MHKPGLVFVMIPCAAIALCFVAACGSKPAPADLVLTNGKIVTVDDARPEAAALAVRGDTIVALGSNEEIAPYVGEKTRVIDLAGKLATPGLIDSHTHFTSIGQAKMGLNLTRAKNWDDIVAMVAEAAKKAQPGEWIVGRGWHQEKWDKRPVPGVEGFPTHESLSKASPKNPVLLTHASGHATFANAKAMQLAGVTRQTPDPPGGEIVKDARGNPIGLFRERASNLVRSALAEARAKRTPEQVQADARREIELADQECLSRGLTTVHDLGVPFETIDLYRQVVAEGRLGVRLYVMVRDDNRRMAENLARYRVVGVGNNHLTVRTIKKSIDGALGPRGAWLLEPYTDLPTSAGLNTDPVETVKEAARLAIANDYQLAVHAIGDRANRETLDIFEAALKANPSRQNLRWRVEHAQHLNPAEIPRLAQLGVVASMQAIHCTSDGPYVLARLGPRRAEEGAYVWRKLMQTGAVIANGTDAPVEEVDPISNYYAAVTRRMKNGEVFYDDQRMTRQEALRSYTLNGAYAAFEEHIKGSLAVGRLADVTVWSKDLLTVPEADILATEALYTIVGGKVMYRK